MASRVYTLQFLNLYDVFVDVLAFLNMARSVGRRFVLPPRHDSSAIKLVLHVTASKKMSLVGRIGARQV